MPEFPEDIALGSTPPALLNEIGRTEWRRLWKQLNKLRFIKDIDRNNLMMYCMAYQDVVKYDEMCRKGQDIFVTDKGYEVKAPAATLKREAMEIVLKISKEFGMTTMARKKMGEMEEQEENEFDLFLKKNKA